MKMRRNSNILLCLATSAAAFQKGLLRFQLGRHQDGFFTTTKLNMGALTPVGPFCPFRSEAAEDFNPRMEEIKEYSPDIAKEISRFQLDLQLGQTPEPERLRKVADGIDQAVDRWESLVTRLRLSPDFQTREYAKLTEAHLNTHGQTVKGLGAMMRWQAGCLRAMAGNTPPPMPPADLDLNRMMAEAEKNEGRPSPSINAMAAAEQITSTPFKDTSVFDSPTVKEEYETLCRDHAALIDFGDKYDKFDPLGKLRFLDEVDKIEERWDIFFARFALMGALNEEYIRQCNQFLESMSMTEDEYRKLLKKAHQMMRAEAEAERNRMAR